MTVLWWYLSTMKMSIQFRRWNHLPSQTISSIIKINDSWGLATWWDAKNVLTDEVSHGSLTQLALRQTLPADALRVLIRKIVSLQFSFLRLYLCQHKSLKLYILYSVSCGAGSLCCVSACMVLPVRHSCLLSSTLFLDGLRCGQLWRMVNSRFLSSWCFDSVSLFCLDYLVFIFVSANFRATFFLFFLAVFLEHPGTQCTFVSLQS